MKLLKLVAPCAVLTIGFLATSVHSFATPAISKKEGNAKCVTCHVAMGKKDLNEVGKCYKESKNLANCSTKK